MMEIEGVKRIRERAKLTWVEVVWECINVYDTKGQLWSYIEYSRGMGFISLIPRSWD